jgi:hypothetical protein
MLLRMIVTGVIACGVIAADSVAMADSAAARLFKGKTAQGKRIMLQVREQTFKIHRFDIKLRCRDHSTLLLEEGGFLWTKVNPDGPDGGFKDAQFGKTDSVYFRGRLGERRIRGQVRVTDKEKGGPFCASRWVAFNVAIR